MQSPKKGSPIHVEIGELVLDGAGPYRADLLARAVEEELARLLAGHDLPAGLLRARQVGRLDGGQLTGPLATSTGGAGAAIAGAIHGGLTGQKSGVNT